VLDVEKVDFVSVPVSDVARAERFYAETLGLRANEHANPDYPEFETGNLTVALVRVDEVTPNSGSIALRVPDIAAARASLESAGIVFDAETIDTGVCHMAFFNDPDGNSLLPHRRYAPYADGSMP
jgi:catechol 2,3-dioxygenase-like lactoylglutathione lyase family enzyme